jgi:hypothetical protein
MILTFPRFPHFHLSHIEANWVDFSNVEEKDWHCYIEARLDRVV